MNTETALTNEELLAVVRAVGDTLATLTDDHLLSMTGVQRDAVDGLWKALVTARTTVENGGK